ncbi:MAG: hypothetical protein WBV31_07630 [Terriglobales bacterium]|jgi:hypothetical protein
MPIRQKVSIDGDGPARQSKQPFFMLRPIAAMIRFGVLAGLLALGVSPRVCAQETPQTQPSPSPAARPPADQAPAAPSRIPPVALYNLLQKKSIVFPDIAYSTDRLSPGQKFELFVDNSISVDSVTWAALGSAVGQADDSPTGFPQGWEGYGKRFGADMARQASGEFFGTFLLASAMHEDPRFYAEINPSFLHAVKYSVQRVFIMRNDDGREVVSWSRLGGPLLAEGLANVYYPDRNRSVGDTLFRFGLDLASRAGGNMLREYWPTVLRKVTRTSKTMTGRP